jgi:Beta-lactamase enzyme family
MMQYQDPHRPQPHDQFWGDDRPVTPTWAKVVSTLIVIAGIVAAVVVYSSRESGGSTKVASTKQPAPVKVNHAETDAKPARQPHHHTGGAATSLPPATKGTPNGVSGGGPAALLGPNAESSFDAMSSTLGAEVGLAVVPLGGGEVEEFGGLREGHAWSSIKVPILSTLLRERGEQLGPEEEGWAESAITASDNEAAAALFGKIEETQGGLTGASRAVEGVLHEAGSAATVVATAPPPPGAVSTYGQTEWSVGDAARFFASLGRCEVLGPSGTRYVESLMESVIPEQRWGLGEGGFPSDWRVAMKGGWGPEAESGGSYLVRQSGLLQDAQGGVAVAMIAMSDSGSYPDGAAALTQIAQWLASELKGLGPSQSSCTG